MLEIVAPEGVPRARGYSHGVIGSGRTLHIAGQIGWDSEGAMPEGLVPQFAGALDNVLAVIRSAGGRPEDLARLTVFVTDIQAYRLATPELGRVWRERFGRHYPAMALVGVAGLVHPASMVEVDGTAHLQG